MRNPSLPFAGWPDQDQKAWAAAVAEGHILDGQGPAAHWRPATRQTNLHGYGRWLAFLAKSRGPELQRGLADRCSRDNVRAYIQQLRATVAPVTVAGSIISLAEMLKIMAPGSDWRWLVRIGGVLKRTAKPSRDKRARMMPAEDMHRYAFKTLRRLAAEPLRGRNQITEFRNLLMVALMTACPLRARNFVSLRLGETLLAGESTWSIQIPAEEHKNGYPLTLAVPDRLVQFLEAYRAKVRPQLIINGDPGSFWLTAYGRPYDEHALYLLFMKITQRYFGRAINPHLFRDCAATSMASDSLSAAMAARSILGHQQFETTERYYIQARQLESSRRINEVIRLAKLISDT